MTGKPNSIHRLDPTWAPRARRVRQSAEAEPATTCTLCGQRLAAHPPHRTGRAPSWVAARQPDGRLRPTASTCAYENNARNFPKRLVLSRNWTTPSTLSADEHEVDPWVIVA